MSPIHRQRQDRLLRRTSRGMSRPWPQPLIRANRGADSPKSEESEAETPDKSPFAALARLKKPAAIAAMYDCVRPQRAIVRAPFKGRNRRRADRIARARSVRLHRKYGIALDAMGGDHGPSVVVPGAALAGERFPEISFIFYGDGEQVQPLLDAHPALAARSRVVHSAVSIAMGNKPSQALRKGRRVSSMWMAIEAIKRGEAGDVTVSAGNTGALMAMAKVCLNTMASGSTGRRSPASGRQFAAESIVLDVGATIGADAHHLVDMAIMGARHGAQIVLGVENPKVGLLNVGAEEIKGIEEVKSGAEQPARTEPRGHRLLRLRRGRRPRPRHGGCRCHGGVYRQYRPEDGRGHRQAGRRISARGDVRAAFMSKLWLYAGARRFRWLRRKYRSPPRQWRGFSRPRRRRHKSHGGTDALGFCGAIEIAYEMAQHELLAQIRETLAADCRT